MATYYVFGMIVFAAVFVLAALHLDDKRKKHK